MILDINTLALISCVTFVTQFVALFVQYSLNRMHHGVKWWLVGTTAMALGVIFMPMVAVPSLEMLARIANPLIILGQIFLYIGIMRFLGKKENPWILVSIYMAFILFYYYFMLVENGISGRALALTVSLTLISFMTAAGLYIFKNKNISGSANFTAIAFAAFSGFSAIRVGWVVFSPPIQDYADQGVILVLSFVVPIITSLLWTFGFIIMMNQRLNLENREEKEKLQMIFNASPDAALISRLSDGLIVDVNAGYSVMSGFDRTELIGNTIGGIAVWHVPTDRESFLTALKAAGQCENLEYVFQRKNGSLLTGSLSAKIITIQTVKHVISVVHDITQRKLAEEAMCESEQLYRSILNASPDDITITDMNGCIQVISPAAKDMFGYAPDYDQFIGSQVLDYILPEEREKARANLARIMNGQNSGSNEYHGVRFDRTSFDIEVTSGIIHDANGKPAKMAFVIRNITERKQAEQRIQQLVQQLEIEKKAAQLNANTDSLTGLANRRYFDQALNTEFQRLKRSGAPLSLIMLDVDHFKKYNDCYGHLAGDDCLRQIGMTLKNMIGRVTDIAARYGGEEFVVILSETDKDGAATLAERIRIAIEALAIPHADSNIAQFITVSLGVVTVHPNQLATAEQAVELADEAMYTAKKDGRNRTSIASENLVLELLKRAVNDELIL